MSLLNGIRVLDLSLQLPGPFCTLMMADYGAEVIKVDEPDPRVRNPFATEEAGLSPADRYLNRGKLSLTLNLKTPEGKEIFGTLAESSDVVVEGFQPGVAARLGAGYAGLSARNPRLVYCSISGYGHFCISPVLSLPEALAHPNARERNMVIEVGSPKGGRDRQPGLPIKIEGVAGAPRRAPFLGEHDEEILRGIGYTAAQIGELRAKGVIRER
jgi:crotonobetainyl-CoA:carnitine CoA-transferase CaiB-like acyl-CoA transferase